MLAYTVFINSAFAFLIVLALILAGGEAIAQSVLLNFIFYVIFTPIIATVMSKVMYLSENGIIVADALSRIHSILENVRLSRPNASRQEVERALHKAQCDDIIAKLPQGIDTMIGTKGVYLSGGEQQRIAIARVMLKNAPVLILDEASAFADPENEALVQRAFERLSKGKTVIMIAHRLTTIKNADHIFVLREGHVEETGTHDSLVERGGLYAKMWQDYDGAVQGKLRKRFTGCRSGLGGI
jgi:ATP-binding cassette subfamily B protein